MKRSLDRSLKPQTNHTRQRLLVSTLTGCLFALSLSPTIAEAPQPGTSGSPSGNEAAFSGTASQWHGFERFDFEFEKRKAIVVTPKKTAEGKPWIWRARFFGHEPQLDIALLEAGFHVVYADVSNLFGSPDAVAHWNQFYSYLVNQHDFHPKPTLEGMSRGGLIIYNWARANPTKVAAIYADAPVLDFRSWPGGPRRKEDRGQQNAWEQLLKAYSFSSDDEAFAYPGNPVDNVQFLVDHKIPLFHVCGDTDPVVPYRDNTGRFKTRYHRAGGNQLYEIVKPHIGHHPHSLKDPAPLVEFVLEQYGTTATRP